ncbi:hypothetical protein B0H17DRAFT_1213762 [Mycena rosella]|uniref:Uncharacterized protein n=1 Tax=Mycena rosella TaxID=1033263 RepID=A0AAD7G123_MYCRO|nr:hypothetical protein B0H17DRAFT_1213762 [Mycena rosella]
MTSTLGLRTYRTSASCANVDVSDKSILFHLRPNSSTAAAGNVSVSAPAQIETPRPRLIRRRLLACGFAARHRHPSPPEPRNNSYIRNRFWVRRYRVRGDRTLIPIVVEFESNGFFEGDAERRRVGRNVYTEKKRVGFGWRVEGGEGRSKNVGCNVCNVVTKHPF